MKKIERHVVVHTLGSLQGSFYGNQKLETKMGVCKRKKCGISFPYKTTYTRDYCCLNCYRLDRKHK